MNFEKIKSEKIISLIDETVNELNDFKQKFKNSDKEYFNNLEKLFNLQKILVKRKNESFDLFKI
jgi:hypothetical protein